MIAFKYPLGGGGGGGVSRGVGSLSMSSTTRMIMKVKEYRKSSYRKWNLLIFQFISQGLSKGGHVNIFW